ncbi:hypothetical protein IFR05_006030 [Cadophora sp. M221]|nr:hypothetical protein IFR05_006030 [Cadophora sp. M221]
MEQPQNTTVEYDPSYEYIEDEDEEECSYESFHRMAVVLNSTVTHVEEPEPVDASDVPRYTVDVDEVAAGEGLAAERVDDGGGVIITERELVEGVEQLEDGDSSSSSSLSSDDNLYYATPRNGRSMSPVTAAQEPNHTTNFETSDWFGMHEELSSRYAGMASEMDSSHGMRSRSASGRHGISEAESEDSGEEGDVDSDFEDDIERERAAHAYRARAEEEMRREGEGGADGENSETESDGESETCVDSGYESEREWWGDMAGDSDSDGATYGSTGSENDTCVGSESEDEDEGGAYVSGESSVLGLGLG